MKAFVRPLQRMAVVGSVIIVSLLVVLAIVSVRSLARFEPVHRHASALKALRHAEAEMLGSLLRGSGDGVLNDEAMAFAADELERALAGRSYLAPASGERLHTALAGLGPAGPPDQDAFLAATREVASVLSDEIMAHDELLIRVEEDARVELLLAAVLTLFIPLGGAAIMFAFRRRFFAPLDRLRALMTRLGSQNYQSVPVSNVDPLVKPVFENYNHLVGRLQALEEQHRQRQHSLEDEVRAATRALLEQQSELARSERLAAVGELAAGVAHELRNPLAGIQVAVGAFAKEAKDSEQRARVEMVVAELKRMTGLLNDLLSSARPAVEPAKTVRLAELAREFLGLARYQVPGAIVLRDTIPIELECVLPEGSLRQALWNVVLNASQAIGDESGEVVVDARHDGDWLEIRVSDDGPGFSPEFLELGIRSFATLREGGTGLGLATVGRFARELGGELRLDNVAPRGASVVIRIPCKRTDV